MRQMAEGHCRHVRMLALSCRKRDYPCRGLSIDPVLVMKTANQLQVRLELPSQLPEALVLFVNSWVPGVDAGLAVVIAQVLVSGKEPKSIVKHRAAEIRREVVVLDPLISAERLTARQLQLDRLAGQT